jgi:hypothetical protein
MISYMCFIQTLIITCTIYEIVSWKFHDLELTLMSSKVKRHYVNWKAIYDFIYVINNNEKAQMNGFWDISIFMPAAQTIFLVKKSTFIWRPTTLTIESKRFQDNNQCIWGIWLMIVINVFGIQLVIYSDKLHKDFINQLEW